MNNLIKATHVNVLKGTMKGGIAKGGPARVVDYSCDGGKTWFNHGVYCQRFLFEIERIVKTLYEVGPITNRAEMIFPRNCNY